jgi:hypothetical protein
MQAFSLFCGTAGAVQILRTAGRHRSEQMLSRSLVGIESPVKGTPTSNGHRFNTHLSEEVTFLSEYVVKYCSKYVLR